MTLAFVKNITETWPQWVAALEVSLLSITIGLVAGWTSPYLAKLIAEDSPLPLTPDQASWVASLMPLGRLIGAIGGAVVMEYIGSKRTLILTGIPLVIGWVCIVCANSAPWLYISRLSSGCSMGMIFSCFPFFIGEISTPKVRGALVGWIVNGMPLGTLFGNIMGPYISMTWFAVISLVINLLFLALFPFLPLSPHFLVKAGNIDEARKSIAWYHRNSNVDEKLATVVRFVEESQPTPLRQRIEEMMKPGIRKAFGIIVVLFFFMQLSGLNTIVFYMEIIIRKAKVTAIDPPIIVMIVNFVGIVIGWISIVTIDRHGRRLLLSVSSVGVALGMFMLGLHFKLLNFKHDPIPLQWLPILALIIFMLMCLGLVPVPSTLLGELFPTHMKSLAGFVGSVTSALFAFVASKTYQPLVNLIGEPYVFWIYAVIMIVSLIYSIYGVPETKGRSLHEIQNMLGKVEEVEGETSD